MNVTKSVIAAAFALCATSTFAGGSVDSYGRASAMPQAGNGPTLTAGCMSCHVSEVQGRAALNYIRTPRPLASDVVTVRNAPVEAVYGRA
jgi:hypothetical protein